MTTRTKFSLAIIVAQLVILSLVCLMFQRRPEADSEFRRNVDTISVTGPFQPIPPSSRDEAATVRTVTRYPAADTPAKPSRVVEVVVEERKLTVARLDSLGGVEQLELPLIDFARYRHMRIDATGNVTLRRRTRVGRWLYAVGKPIRWIGANPAKSAAVVAGGLILYSAVR